jgi:hypothetical protein
MKTIILFFAVALLCLQSFAQSNKRLTYINDYKAQNNVIETERNFYNEYSYPTTASILPNERIGYSRSNTSLPFEPITKSLYVYRTDGNISEEIQLLWNGTQWNNSRKYTHNYDQSTGQYLGYGFFSWYANSWYEIQRKIYGYNNNGVMAYTTEMDTVNATLVYTFGYDSIYDANGRVSNYKVREYINNNWWEIEDYRFNYTGNSSRIDSVLKFYTPDPVNIAMALNRRYYYTYNIANQVTQIREKTANNNNEYLRKSFAYDNITGLEVSEEQAYWDIDSNAYVTNFGIYKSYDNLLRLIQQTRKIRSANSMINEREEVFYYAPDSSVVSITLSQINYNTLEYSLSGKTEYLFETINQTSIESKTQQQITKAYPNPFTTNTIIEFESTKNAETTIKIFNALGKTVVEKTLFAIAGKNSFFWDGNNNSQGVVAPGCYFIHINQNNFSNVSRVIKR